MPKFILIDQSLKAVGGHHYDYAMQVCRAAQANGYQVVLASHRRFRPDRQCPAAWLVQACFQYTTYSPHAAFESGRSRVGKVVPAGVRTGWPQFVHGTWSYWDRRRRIASFQRACQQVLHRHVPQEADIVFLPTLSEFDFEALASYLLADPASQPPSWHVQFHYSFAENHLGDGSGCQEELDSRSQRKGDVLRQLSERLTGHRIRYYAVTDQLAEEYRRWTGISVQPLAWPINPRLLPAKPMENRLPAAGIRGVVAGAIRDEKGHADLVTLVRAMMTPASPLSHLSLVLQCNKPRYRRQLLAACTMGAPDPGEARDQFHQRVTLRKHPLTEAEYTAMIVGADLGILLYDRTRYAVRRAGVLGEFLAAGVPTLVPADCWLSRQFSETNYRYLDEVYEDEVRRVGEDQCYRPSHGSPPTVVPVPPATSHVMISLAEQPGRVIELRFQDAQGRQVGQWTALLDPRDHGLPQRYLAKVPHGAHPVELVLSSSQACGISFHCSGPDQTLPLGANGLSFGQKSQWVTLLADIVQHHEHYRQQARQFSQIWRAEHDPAETVRQLGCSS